MGWLEALAWLANAAGSGLVAFVAQKLLTRAYKKLEELRSQPLGSAADQDLEELLTHLVDEVGSFEDLTTLESVYVIRLQIGVTTAYLAMRVKQLTPSADKGKPGGT